jgi:c-di-AMP phosphodiesterase-like protein
MASLSNDAILTQLDYTVTPSALAQLEAVKENTQNFENVEKHLLALHERLKSYFSYVALSSTKEYFKIKNEAQSDELKEEVTNLIYQWSQKYKIEIEKVSGKDTYYVLGYK